jgi:hypothetical protein
MAPRMTLAVQALPLGTINLGRAVSVYVLIADLDGLHHESHDIRVSLVKGGAGEEAQGGGVT